MTEVTAEDIVRTLEASPRPPHALERKIYPFAGKMLMDIVGNRLEELVDLTKLFEVTAELLRRLVDNEQLLSQLGGEDGTAMMSVYNGLAQKFYRRAQNPSDFLREVGNNEAAFVEGLLQNQEARTSYRNGQLTFAKLLKLYPAIFVPDVKKKPVF
jgi:hypothetical protein